MTVQWLIQWWNLIFVLPMGLALLYLGLMTFSGVTFGEADADHDFDADHDLEADHDVEADADADADGDADSDHDAEADDASDNDVSPAMAALSWLGVGSVPLSILLMVGLLTWGGTGLICSAILQDRGAAAAWIAIPVAALASIMTAHFVAAFINRFFPLNEEQAPRRHALLGQRGEAMLPISETFGMVSVRDVTGNLYQVACRTSSATSSISKGESVRLVAYNASRHLFLVERETAPAGK